MIRTLAAPSWLLLLVASVALGQGTTPAPFPTSRLTPEKELPRPKVPPKQPLPDCYPDRYGKLICPNPGPKPGDACKTTAGADGILARTSSTSSVVCLTTGDACWSSSGQAGKIWGTTSKVCAGLGDSCPASSGTGRVFQEGAGLVCLALGASCTCASGTTGCKVMGYADYQTWECAQKTVNCPMTASATVKLSPSSAQASSTQVPLARVMQTSSSAISCSYKLSGSDQQASYSFDCPKAATSTLDARWLSCGGGPANVKCDVPVASSATLAPEVVTAMGLGTSTPTPGVATSFLRAEHDAARTKGFCKYKIDSITFSATIPCKSPKNFGDSYRCY